MTSNFKPGDLALVINHTFPPVFGTCVELISRHLVGPVDRKDPMDPGVYEQEGWEAVWVVSEDQAIVWEKWLMPLRGYFAPEQAKSREVSA